MGIDLVGQFIAQYNSYGRLRGTRRGTGNPMATSRNYPRTTWADVVVASVHFSKYGDPSREDCISLIMKHKNLSKSEASGVCAFGDRSINPLNFVKTKGYRSAKKAYYKTTPVHFLGFFGALPDLNEEYPHNEKFWYAAHALMIERSAAGVVPFWSEIALDSVKEAIVELPSTIGNALREVDPRKLIPNMSPLVEFIKWGSVAGGLFLLYKAMEPQKDKRK